jgi:hypothetical protein
MGMYFESIGKLIEIDIEKVIMKIKTYMNLIEKDFIV